MNAYISHGTNCSDMLDFILYVTIGSVCLISISSVMTLIFHDDKRNRSKAPDSGAETKSVENHIDELEQSSSGDDAEMTVTDGTVGINDFVIRVDGKDTNK